MPQAANPQSSLPSASQDKQCSTYVGGETGETLLLHLCVLAPRAARYSVVMQQNHSTAFVLEERTQLYSST